MRIPNETTPLISTATTNSTTITHLNNHTEDGSNDVVSNPQHGASSTVPTSIPPPHLHRRPRSDSHATTGSSSTTAQLLSEIVADVKEELIEVLQEDVITPIKPREEGDHAYKLSAVALAVMVFYKVSGGPFGCEPTVKAAGPFYALLGFILFPILWSIPEAFITAELGSAYPEPSGRTS